jgi:hypothetical protein
MLQKYKKNFYIPGIPAFLFRQPFAGIKEMKDILRERSKETIRCLRLRFTGIYAVPFAVNSAKNSGMNLPAFHQNFPVAGQR